MHINSYDTAKDLFTEFNSLSDNRREIQSVRYSILNDNTKNLVVNRIYELFSDVDNRSDLVKFLDLSNNSYKSIINLLATVYKDAAIRSFEDQSDNDLYHSIVDSEQLDVLLEKVNRLTISLNECILHICIRDEKPSYDIILPQSCVVYSDGPILKAILYQLENETYIYWDEKLILYLDKSGKLVHKEPNRYGVLPFVVFRREYPASGFWLGPSGEDLVELYYHQVIYRTYLKRISYYQSYMQITQDSHDANAIGASLVTMEKQTLGPHTFLEGKFSVLDLKTDLTSFYNVIELSLQRVAANWGISADTLTHSKHTSGLERLLANAGLLEYRKSLIKLFRPADVTLMKLTCHVWNIDKKSGSKFTESPKPSIDYSDLSLVESPREEIEVFKVKLDYGLASPVDWIMKKNPDITTRDKAMDYIKRNLSELDIVLEFKRSKQIPENQDIATKTEEGNQGGRPVEPTKELVVENETKDSE